MPPKRTKEVQLGINRAVFTVVSTGNWFYIITLRDWLKKLAPLFDLIRSKTKPDHSLPHTFSFASRQLHVFTMSFAWFIGLPVSFVIGQSDYFGFGFTTLN